MTPGFIRDMFQIRLKYDAKMVAGNRVKNHMGL